MFKFFRNLRYRMMTKTSSSFILGEFAAIVTEAVEHLEKEGRIKSPLYKAALLLEGTGLVFWMFRRSNVFPDPMHTLFLDEVHNQYFGLLRKKGYDRNAIQSVCDGLNASYQAYDRALGESRDCTKAGAEFIRRMGKVSQTDISALDLTIPMELMGRATLTLSEFKKVIST
jgi:hypothetical protein